MNRSMRVAVVLAAGLCVLTGCRSCKQGKQEKIALKPPTGPPKRPQGMTALTVTSAPEPFKKLDVEAYFKTHNIPRNSGPANLLRVDSLEFITSRDVTARLQGVSTGLTDTERVAFAVLSGQIVFTGPKTSKAARFDRAYAVFDAANGNLLMVGSLATQQPNR